MRYVCQNNKLDLAKTMPNKTKRKTTKPNPPPRPKKGSTPQLPNKSVHSVCGLSDPFCEHARGAKYPDDAATRTLPFTYHGRRELVSNASGHINAMFFPQFKYDPVTLATTPTGNDVTAWDNFDSNGFSTTPDAMDYRIVSVGFRLHAVGAPLNASGMVHLRQYGTLEGTDLTTIDLLTYNSSDSKDVSYRSMDVISVVVPHTSQRPAAFYNPADDAATMAAALTKGFGPVSIAGNGLEASTGQLEVEWLIHYELTLSDNNVLAQAATPAPAYSPLLVGAANRVTSQISAFIIGGAERVGDLITRKAIDALRTMTMRSAPLLLGL